MPVDQAKLQTKLTAILSKDLQAITAAHIFIPTLGTNYSQASLQAWIDKRTDVLNNSKTFTDAQISSAITTLRNQCSTAGKVTADKILAGEPYTLVIDADYERLVLIVLYKFVTS